MEVIQKYLESYSSHKQFGYTYPKESYDVALVVPLRGENALFGNCLRSVESAALHAKKKVILIAVVNHRIDDNEKLKNDNRTLLRELQNYQGPLTVLPVDCASEGVEFPLKQGVGLARKTGCDLALDLFAQGKIRGRHVYTTDGDATLPLNFFEEDPPSSEIQIHLFRHTPCGDERVDRATVLYEKWLRYYVLGLNYARSPYAYQTVGSLLAMDYKSYATVRGFPRKEAGEDFYLLNKLAKVGKISTRRKTVSLKSRASDRVPFGTGRGVLDILGLSSPDEYTFYNPRVFEVLKDWLAALTHFSETRDAKLARDTLKNSLSGFISFGEEAFENFWKINAFSELLETADKTRPKDLDCLRHLHSQFDGFRTLRFVHLLRDHFLPDLKPDEALTQATFTQGFSDLESLQRIEEELN